MKKCVCLVLCIAMLIGVAMIAPISASAAETENESVSASGVKTQNEAVAWLNAQEGARYNLDGAYGSQCSDFTSAYVNYVLTGDPYGGRIGVYNAKEYSNAGLYPSDWQVIQNSASFVPQPGDIFVVTGADSRYGHTGVVISSDVNNATVADQNGLSDWSLDYGSPAHIHYISWSGSFTPRYFIRPCFSSFAPNFKASVPRGQDSVYMTSEDVTMSVNATDYNSCWLTIVHTPVGGNPSTFWEGAVSNSYTRKFPEQGYYSCYFKVTVGGNTYDSGWVGWNVFLSYNATVDKGNDGQYSFGENVIISVDNSDFDSCYLQIYHTPTGGSTSRIWSGDVSKDPVIMNFNEAGHYSCNYMITRKGKTFSSNWVGWDVIACNPIDIGSVFYAKLAHAESGKCITQENPNGERYSNVALYQDDEKEDNTSYQLWRFERQSDLSYIITNAKTGHCLDDYNAAGSNGNNVIAHEKNGSDAQRWYFVYGNGSSFSLVPKCAQGFALDLNGNFTSEGTNIQIYQRHQMAAQLFEIIQIVYLLGETEYNGNKYQLFNCPVSWKLAKELCEDEGGHLVTITSKEEENAVNELRSANSNPYVWIGATDESGSWKWVTGENFNYSNWDSGQPDNYQGVEHYACIWGTSKWNDYDNYASTYVNCYICEFEKQEAEIITLNKTKLNLEAGKTETLSATISPSNTYDKTITWTSSNTKVATVDNGKVIGVSAGTAVITAATSNGKTATCTVTVNNPEPEKKIKNGVYYENGVAKNPGLVKVGNDIYCTTRDGKLIYGDKEIYSSRTNGLLPPGVYHFDEVTGKLYKDNVIIDGIYYKGGKASNPGIVKFAGSFYVTTTNGVILKDVYNKPIYSSRTNGLVAVGTYDFGPDGKMILKNGIVGGKYYINGKASNPGLFAYEIDGVNNIYCTTTDGVILKNVTDKYIYSSRTNGLAKVGYHSFDGEGRMIK